MAKIYDVVIIGSGPAALTAAIYAAREKHSVLVVEKGATGGLMATIDKIDNYPGRVGVTGMELADLFWQQAESFGVEMKFAEALKCCKIDNVVKITTDDGDIEAKTMVISTGNGYRKLDIPGGQNVHYCATCDGPYYVGKKLAVIGGGNSAVQESIFLSQFASHVELISRHPLKANKILQDELKKQTAKITCQIGQAPLEIVDKKTKKIVKLEGGKTVEVDGIFVFIGSVPSSAWLEGSGVKLDAAGYVLTDKALMTNVAGIFAAGDIRSGSVKQIAVAVGEGAIAAHSIRDYLEKY